MGAFASRTLRHVLAAIAMKSALFVGNAEALWPDWSGGKQHEASRWSALMALRLTRKCLSTMCASSCQLARSDCAPRFHGDLLLGGTVKCVGPSAGTSSESMNGAQK